MEDYTKIPMSRLPEWLQKKSISHDVTYNLKSTLRERHLHTVCESAKCPNIGECFKKPTATFMILGDTCTRNCKFCNVKKGIPLPPDENEPQLIAQTSLEMNLKHIVITSVDRDDLSDGGVSQFVKTIREIRKIMPKSTTIEILTPDFNGDENILKELIGEEFDIFNHNLETVKSLYSLIRPKANYMQSLNVLSYMKNNANKITKTGIMLGLGETKDEIIDLFKDVHSFKVDALTIGQYLRPSRVNYPVIEYILPEIFDEYLKTANEIGIKFVSSSPYVRSSYKAEQLMEFINGTK